VLFCWRERGPRRQGDRAGWTGWAWIPPAVWPRVHPGDTESDLEARLLCAAAAKGSLVEVARPLDVRTFRGLLEAQRRVLLGEFNDGALAGRETEPGLRVCRNTRIGQDVALAAPSFVGENCRLSDRAGIGPGTVVSADCVVDRGTKVEDSVIFPRSYLGEGLEVSHAIVCGNLLIDVDKDVSLSVPDDFVLGPIRSPSPLSFIARGLGRLCAAALLLPALPVMALSALCLRLCGRKVRHSYRAVRLPAPTGRGPKTFEVWSFSAGFSRGEPWPVADFLLRLLPGLWQVARGRLCFVGVPPRTFEEVERLPEDWQTLYLGARPGLITEAYVRHGPSATEEERRAAETVYAATSGPWKDARLLAAYFGKVLSGRRPGPIPR
jgi:hypothetical protein